MKDIEKQLERAVLRTPTAQHQARMATLFDSMAPAPRLLYRPVRMWQCMAACVLCVVSGYALAAVTSRGDASKVRPEATATSTTATPSTTAAPSTTPQFGLVRQQENGWVEITVLEAS